MESIFIHYEMILYRKCNQPSESKMLLLTEHKSNSVSLADTGAQNWTYNLFSSYPNSRESILYIEIVLKKG